MQNNSLLTFHFVEVKVKERSERLTVYDWYLTGLKADKPEVHGIDDFIAYFECTLLGSQFAPAKWNVYSEEGPRWQEGPEGDGHHVEEIKTLESKPL